MYSAGAVLSNLQEAIQQPDGSADIYPGQIGNNEILNPVQNIKPVSRVTGDIIYLPTDPPGSRQSRYVLHFPTAEFPVQTGNIIIRVANERSV